MSRRDPNRRDLNRRDPNRRDLLHGTALALAAAVVPTGPARAAPVTIRLGYGEVPGDISPLLFEKTEILRHYGRSYTVEPIYFQGTSVALQAMAARELDVSYIAFSSLGLAILNGGLDLKVIADVAGWSSKGHQGPEYLVRADSGIATLADLRGKVLATSARGSGFHYAMLANLKKAGLVEKTDFTVVEVRLPAMEATLREKKVDLVTATPPFLQTMERNGGVRRLFRPEDAMGEVQSLVHVARAEFLREQRAAVVDFLEDSIRALRWFLDPANQTEAAEITARFTKRPASVYQGWVFGRGDFYRDPEKTPDIAALQRNLDTVHDLGVLRRRVEVAPHVDLAPLAEAKARLGTN
ncbi:MAG: ABC transporter substrate-binding protein [Rhodovulum sp.]|nr:ABC transporter substrate-binding protein [Rhodovulum sp.]